MSQNDSAVTDTNPLLHPLTEMLRQYEQVHASGALTQVSLVDVLADLRSTLHATEHTAEHQALDNKAEAFDEGWVARAKRDTHHSATHSDPPPPPNAFNPYKRALLNAAQGLR